jgi:hypothetical protein
MRSDTLITRRTFLAGVAVPIVLSSGSKGWAQDLPRMTVTKDPTCGCCSGWVEHIKAAGFPVKIVETGEMNRVKARLGAPRHLAACHTAEVEAYVIEGHVPAKAIRRLLAERPQVKGLAVPGMPVGSPGMEVEGAPPEPYDVIAFGPTGETHFARFKGADPV